MEYNKGFNFKAGDLIRCKKDYRDKYGRILLDKDSYYKISSINHTGIYIKMLVGSSELIRWYKKVKDRDMWVGELTYYTIVKDVFYTKEEDRKIKLDSLLNGKI